MQYRKAGMARMVLLALALVLAGCKDKGEAFVGHWVQVKVKEGKKASSLDIELDDGVFHINYKWHTVFTATEFDETLREKKIEAKAESNNVLTVITKFTQTMKLSGDIISFDNKEFKKVN